MTILECPRCSSNRASVVNTEPLSARCADCGRSYPIKAFDPNRANKQRTSGDHMRPGDHKKTKPDPIPVPSVGPLTEFIDNTINGGPKGLRDAQREANRLAKKF